MACQDNDLLEVNSGARTRCAPLTDVKRATSGCTQPKMAVEIGGGSRYDSAQHISNLY
jgi:hypothetical protein